MKEVAFYCSECGAEFTKWEGKCRFCENWNTIREFKKPIIKKGPKAVMSVLSLKKDSCAVPISEVNIDDTVLYKIGNTEIDNLFGGGLVKGGAYLLGGEPGVGKSTFLLTLAKSIPGKILYVSGEETIGQIRQRAERLHLLSEALYLANLDSTEEVESILINDNGLPNYSFLFIDSIQTISTQSIENAPGSVVQVRASAAQLISLCKRHEITLILTGHINKSGDLAGPRVLEHLVDATLLMYSQTSLNGVYDLRICKPLKNRFGTTDTTALFTMDKTGLNPASRLQLSPDLIEEKGVYGSCLYPHFIGKRLLFSSIEALVVSSENKFPNRSAEGISSSRLARIIAIMQKYAGIDPSGFEVYVNVSGGIKNDDVNMDLAILASIYSSYTRKNISPNMLFLGEAGLDGRIKVVRDIDFRLKEIASYGEYTLVYNPGKRTEGGGPNVGDVKNVESFLATINHLWNLTNNKK